MYIQLVLFRSIAVLLKYRVPTNSLSSTLDFTEIASNNMTWRYQYTNVTEQPESMIYLPFKFF
jgi:hypothetical protein